MRWAYDLSRGTLASQRSTITALDLSHQRAIRNWDDSSDWGGVRSKLTPSNNKSSLVILSARDCRRGKLRRNGNLAVGAGMDLRELRKIIGEYAGRSGEYPHIET
jgi:hypothetical protein